MDVFRRLLPRSLTAQITIIAAISTLIGIAFSLAIVVSAVGVSVPRPNLGSMASQIFDLSRLIRSAATPSEADVILSSARNVGIDVQRVARADLTSASDTDRSVSSSLAISRLKMEPGIEILQGLRYLSGPRNQVVIGADPQHALVFGMADARSPWRFFATPAVLMLAIVMIFALLLSLYSIRWIIAPLAAVANAAHSFGRSPADHKMVGRNGPREIRQVADAINEMRTRIRALLDDRSRMLAAISHDLRTPLTRLRLRAERVGDPVLADAMLGDVATISRMLDETLDYLREDARSEPMTRIDLPSLLQTICSDFADIGHAVSYCGVARLTCACRPRALTRVLNNVVENGLKHGTAVIVEAGIGPDGSSHIDIRDNGAGIPEELRERVFEPFFKADSARGAPGFGLGLSIAKDLMTRQGGRITLLDSASPGLTVRLTLAADTAREAA